MTDVHQFSLIRAFKVFWKQKAFAFTKKKAERTAGDIETEQLSRLLAA